jgi:hypothetical protein
MLCFRTTHVNPRLVLAQRQQLRESGRVAGFDARQDADNVVHGRASARACNSRRNVPVPLRERVRECLIFVRV